MDGPSAIYLDHAATTPLRPEVLHAMEPWLSGTVGNPSSTHRHGREAAAALDDARARLAGALGAGEHRVLFVGGGTESDNLAVQGRARAARAAGTASPAVVRSALEHAAVRESARAVAREGGREYVVPTDPSGAPDLDRLERHLRSDPDVALASFLWVSNEVGTVHPMAELVDRARNAGVPLHSDAVQAVGKVEVDLEAIPVDLLTLTGHKLGGPRGAAALLVREGVELIPLHHGGGQEGGLRPGTQDVAGAVGLAHAVALAVAEQEEEARRLELLREELARGLAREVPGLRIHAEGGRRAPHILSVGVPVEDGEALLMALDLEGVAASRGSACSSGASRVGPVLGELLGDGADDRAPLRFSLGRTTSSEEVERAVTITATVVERIRRLEDGGRGSTAPPPPRERVGVRRGAPSGPAGSEPESGVGTRG